MGAIYSLTVKASLSKIHSYCISIFMSRCSYVFMFQIKYNVRQLREAVPQLLEFA